MSRPQTTIEAFMKKTLPGHCCGLQILNGVFPFNPDCWFAFRYDHMRSRWMAVDTCCGFHYLNSSDDDFTCTIWNIMRMPIVTLDEVKRILNEDKLKHRLEEL